MRRTTIVAALGAATALVAAWLVAVAPAQAQTITLHGAVQFNDEHAFNRSESFNTNFATFLNEPTLSRYWCGCFALLG